VFPHRARVAALLLVFVAAGASGQQAVTSATLSGRVQDSSGGVLAGAQARLTNTGTNQRFTTTTDARGRFRFARVPVGPYVLTVSKDGFVAVQQALTAAAGQALEIPVTLPGSPRQSPSASPRPPRSSRRSARRSPKRSRRPKSRTSPKWAQLPDLAPSPGISARTRGEPDRGDSLCPARDLGKQPAQPNNSSSTARPPTTTPPSSRELSTARM
jgi:hypothetical protein